MLAVADGDPDAEPLSDAVADAEAELEVSVLAGTLEFAVATLSTSCGGCEPLVRLSHDQRIGLGVLNRNE